MKPQRGRTACGFKEWAMSQNEREARLLEHVRQKHARVYSLNGRLLWHRDGLILEPDEGGFWIIYAAAGLSRYAGQRVTVEGSRVDFNGLDVRRYKLAAADWPVSFWTRLKRWFGR
jgi:hypothetical protein